MIAAIAVVFQALTGYTNLGARIGIERTAGIVVSGGVLAIVLLLWSTAVDVKPIGRMYLGVGATIAATIVTLALLWVTFALHTILIIQTREGNITSTTFRGALTKAEATVGFYSAPPNTIALMSIDTHDSDSTNAARVEHTSDTDFTFHAFQYDQRITITHRSEMPLHLIVDTDGPVTFTPVPDLRKKMGVATAWGGLACMLVSLFIYWRSRWPRPQSTPKHSTRTAAKS